MFWLLFLILLLTGNGFVDGVRQHKIKDEHGITKYFMSEKKEHCYIIDGVCWYDNGDNRYLFEVYQNAEKFVYQFGNQLYGIDVSVCQECQDKPESIRIKFTNTLPTNTPYRIWDKRQ